MANYSLKGRLIFGYVACLQHYPRGVGVASCAIRLVMKAASVSMTLPLETVKACRTAE